MYKLDKMIVEKKEMLERLMAKVKMMRQEVGEVEKRKREIVRENSSIEQELFVKELDVKYLKGEITEDEVKRDGRIIKEGMNEKRDK